MAQTQILLPILDRATSTIMLYGHDMAGKLMPYGLELYTGLAILMLAWQGINIMLEQGALSDVMGELLRTLFFIGFVYWMLGSGTSQGYLDNVINPITGLLDSVADTMAGGNGTYSGSIISGANAILKMLDIPSLTYQKLMEGTTGWIDTISVISANLLLFVLIAAQWVLILVSVLIYMLMSMAGMILLSLAIGIGPLFIPFLLFEPLRNFFSGWFEFFIGACLYKVVSAGFVGIISTTLVGITTQLQSHDASADISNNAIVYAAGQNFMISVIATAFALLAGYMMMQIPNISRGLLSGSAAANIKGAVPSRKPSPSGNAGSTAGAGAAATTTSAAAPAAAAIKP